MLADTFVTVPMLLEAHREFAKREPEGVVLYAGTVKSVSAAMETRNIPAVVLALAKFFRSWNRSVFRAKPQLHHTLEADLTALLNHHFEKVKPLGQRDVKTFSNSDKGPIRDLFNEFNSRLWPVGSAKVLHALAPSFLPLWDTPIAEHYGVRNKTAEDYLFFIEISRLQLEHLLETLPNDVSRLRYLDEYNYCKYTHQWI